MVGGRLVVPVYFPFFGVFSTFFFLFSLGFLDFSWSFLNFPVYHGLSKFFFGIGANIRTPREFY